MMLHVQYDLFSSTRTIKQRNINNPCQRNGKGTPYYLLIMQSEEADTRQEPNSRYEHTETLTYASFALGFGEG